MRARFVAFVAFAFLIGAPAAMAADEPAASLPDLPGMRVAEDATRGQVAPSSASSQSDTGVASAGNAPASDSSKAASTGPPDAGPIENLPGSGVLPGIGKQRVGLASVTTAVVHDGLAALAALGTILSVGGFLLLRNRLNEN